MMRLGAKPGSPLREQGDVPERTLPALAKISGDQLRMRELLWSWNDGRGDLRAAS
jgi:hypothetical protein